MTNIPTFLVSLAATTGVCVAEIMVNVNSAQTQALSTSAGLVRLVDVRDGQAIHPAFSGLRPGPAPLHARGDPQTVKKPTLF